MHPTSRFTAAALFVGTVLALPSLRADTLGWGTSGYTYNASQASTNATPGAVGTVNGNAVGIEYGTPSYFNTSNAAEATPAVGTYNASTTPIFTDGGTGGGKALQIFANFDNAAGNIIAGASISVTVFFSRPVSNLMFSFYDVDGTATATPFTDYITNISGTNFLGVTVAPITLTPSAGYNTSNLDATTYGSFKGGTTNAAQNTGAANAGVDFGGQSITSFTFNYTDTAAAGGGSAHSTTQIIALSDLTFVTVPEPSTWALLLAGVGAVFAFGRRGLRTR